MSTKILNDPFFEEIKDILHTFGKGLDGTWSPSKLLEGLVESMDKTFHEEIREDGTLKIKVFLPEFKKEEINVQLDEHYGSIVVEGKSAEGKEIVYAFYPSDHGMHPSAVETSFDGTVLSIIVESASTEMVNIPVS